MKILFTCSTEAVRVTGYSDFLFWDAIHVQRFFTVCLLCRGTIVFFTSIPKTYIRSRTGQLPRTRIIFWTFILTEHNTVDLEVSVYRIFFLSRSFSIVFSEFFYKSKSLSGTHRLLRFTNSNIVWLQIR